MILNVGFDGLWWVAAQRVSVQRMGGLEREGYKHDRNVMRTGAPHLDLEILRTMGSISPALDGIPQAEKASTECQKKRNARTSSQVDHH